MNTIHELKEKFDSGVAIKYIFFWGHTNKTAEPIGKFVFSQWYPSPFTVDGVEYKTAEHWMMAHKASLFGDIEIFNKILSATKPGEVKELGRQIRRFDEIKWNKWKYEIVKIGNIHKFHQNIILKEYLRSTSDRVIVEASPTDNVWGIGLPQDSKMIENPYTWNGENLLGFALMEVRDFLKELGDFTYVNPTMLPPWKKYPKIDSGEMFWRMGKGEEYIGLLSEYFQSLSPKEMVIYELSNPASGDWIEFYNDRTLISSLK
jgi:ribA/ribD-fused uncharacterized protein